MKIPLIDYGYLKACYETGYLGYPTYSAIGPADSVEQKAWKEGWDDAQDLKDCMHFDLIHRYVVEERESK